MRLMSFHLTTQQFIDGSKDVTRRLGWAFLKPCDHFMAVEKCQGLNKGEHVKKLGECVVVSNDGERLDLIIAKPFRENIPMPGGGYRQASETYREGFFGWTPEEFVEMFCREMHCTPETVVNRIEFRRI